jgi:3-oxoacyl-[acyl-carrier protein] reductase
VELELGGSVAVVTGAAKGIGRATAIAFAHEGANVALLDVDIEGARSAAEEVLGHGVEATVHEVDMAECESVRCALQEVHARFGRLDVLANVAAIFPKAKVAETTEELWDRGMGVNLRGPFFACKEAMRIMIPEGRGAIVNVSSTSAYRPLEGRSIYSAAKAAMIGMSRVMALECAKTGVRVNVVAPGHTSSEHALQELDDPEGVAATWVSGRWMTPEEQARTIVWVASPAASGLNGTVVHVNGGIWMA